MKKLSILIPFMVVACGVDQDILDFRADQNISENSNEIEPVPGTGGSPQNQGSNGFGGANHAYEPGGYAGGQSIERNGASFDLFYGEPCSLEQSRILYSWSEDACRAGSLCTTGCESNADCNVLDGPLNNACVNDPHFGGKTCVLTCNNDADCLEGMICAISDGDGVRSCMLAETPWAPGCENFCLDDESGYWSALCNQDAPCCAGLSCSPEGACQARECLPGFWECQDGGTPCCAGTSCQGGYCQP